MILHNFQNVYKEAVNELPKFHMDAATVKDEVHHRRVNCRGIRQTVMRSAAAILVFLLCGVGTVTAVNYSQKCYQSAGKRFYHDK